MAESIAEQVAAALKTALAGIVGDGGTTYWYTPDKVVRVSFFPDQFALDPAQGDVIYILSPGSEELSEAATGRLCRSEHEFVLQVARQHRVATENPYIEGTPTRWTVVNRLVRDAFKKLTQDVQVGGIAVNVNTDGMSVDREQYTDGWAMAQIRFTVTFDFVGDTP